MDVLFLLAGISFILFFGYLVEYLFKRTFIPDVLFLIILGILIGPFGFDFIRPQSLSDVAPVFTTFALFFLVYHGAFNIDIRSLFGGLKLAFGLTVYNMAISVGAVSIIMFFITSDVLLSLLCGFVLGGVSSAFVIPVIKQLRLSPPTYSALMLESTFTDVFTIVFSLSIMEILLLGTVDLANMGAKFFMLFAIAGIVGVVSAAIWIILLMHIFRDQRAYMITIAYLIGVYVATEYLGGNGVIAALFFGLILRNSKSIANSIVSHIRHKGEGDRNSENLSAISFMERQFYAQISFFLKTFFFVYVGLLFDPSNVNSLLVGALLSVAVMASRYSSRFIFKLSADFEREMASSIFARGLAAAAVADILTINKVPGAELVASVVYPTIIFTIALSSINVFMMKWMFDGGIEEAGK